MAIDWDKLNSTVDKLRAVSGMDSRGVIKEYNNRVMMNEYGLYLDWSVTDKTVDFDKFCVAKFCEHKGIDSLPLNNPNALD